MHTKFDTKVINSAIKEYPTPFHMYDEVGIRQTAKTLNAAFQWNKGFRNYFAIKALPNPRILEILLSEGMGLDCSSMPELLLAERVGAQGTDIIFSSNDTSAGEFRKARKLGATINLDDITHISFLKDAAGLPDLLSFRYNPGSLIGGNPYIGYPEQAKYGMTRKQILQSIKNAQKMGVMRFGVHTMLITQNLDLKVALQITRIMFELADEIYKLYGIQLEFIDFGGGVGIPYKPSEKPFDIAAFGNGVEEQMRSILNYEPALYMECGRYITGPHGCLVSKVLHIKDTYKKYIGLDASMQNLMRAGMYGAYHKIDILGKDDKSGTEVYDVTGSLCENNDKFAIDRELPITEVGDTVVISDTGAHGHAMGFNYNGKLRSAEVLLRADGTLELIRRAETPEDLFATLDIQTQPDNLLQEIRMHKSVPTPNNA